MLIEQMWYQQLDQNNSNTDTRLAREQIYRLTEANKPLRGA